MKLQFKNPHVTQTVNVNVFALSFVVLIVLNIVGTISLPWWFLLIPVAIAVAGLMVFTVVGFSRSMSKIK